MHVAVANGNRVSCTDLCALVPMIIGQEEFQVGCFTIPLDGFDLILGIQWLRTLGPIVWDFELLTVSFWWINQCFTWQGFGAAIDKPRILSITGQELMTELLQEFDDLFESPRGLSPELCRDHRIHLLPGTVAMAVWPYRDP